MFDFLFKRATKPVVMPLPSPTQGTSFSSQAVRDAARAQAETVAHDEAACVDFLLVCEFADARLIAAQSIQTKDALQRVLKALRNTDRRVARLMQSRLDTMQVQQQVTELALHCVEEATAMSTQPQLTPQKVGEIDRRWAVLTTVPPALQQSFAAVRTVLGERLVQQADLQRQVIDTLAALRQLSDGVLPAPSDELQAALAQHETDIALFDASAEVVNLPKNLLDQCRAAANAARSTLTIALQRDLQHAVLITQLQLWEATLPASLDPASLQREWHLATQSMRATPELQARFVARHELVAANQPAQVSAVPISTRAASAAASNDQLIEYSAALQALELALAQGVLQQALDADRRLRLVASVASQSASQTAQLTRLRTQLSQLQSWARWGGNISREELQKAALGLPEQQLKLVELAKKIGTLRQQWKALDVSAGPAPRQLWHSFDTASTAAYAPVAEHHRVLSEARQKNSVIAHQQIAALEQAADQLSAEDQPDWKAIAQLCQRAQQEWQRIGPTERRDKQALVRQFQIALQRMLQPLGVTQKAEQQLREQLIASVLELRATQHGTMEALRALQQQWQEHANAVPLDRRDEQALWLRFRAACDAVFAQRKENAAGEDKQRQANLQAREALCATLERAGAQPIGALTAMLRDSAASWAACGAVSRMAHDTIEGRYQRAVGALRKHIDDVQHALADTERQVLRQKLQLCQRLDAVLLEGSDTSADLIAQHARSWEELAGCSIRLDATLAHRFEQAMQAYRSGDRDYLQRLISNQSVVQSTLLRLEIILSLDSPPELARERLALQVAVLQSALRDGPQASKNSEHLSALCALPVALDADTATRFERIVARLLA